MSLLMYHCYLYISISKRFLKKKLIFFVGTFKHHFFCFINKGPQFALFPAPVNYAARSDRHSGLHPSLSDWSAYVIHRGTASLWSHSRNEGQNDMQSLCSWYCLWTDILVLNCHLYIYTKIRSFGLLFVLFSIMSKTAHVASSEGNSLIYLKVPFPLSYSSYYHLKYASLP